MPDLLAELLENIARSHEIAARCEVRVEYEREGGRTAYRMSCRDKRSLDLSVQQRMDEAENAPHGGFAQFLTPWLDKTGRWMTRGEVVIFPMAEAAE